MANSIPRLLIPWIFSFILSLWLFPQTNAEEQTDTLEYIEIDPVIITNYSRPKSRKPGFIQLQAQLTVKTKASVDMLEKHMPLVRDYIIEYLSFTDEAIIKDVSKRREFRLNLSAGIQKMLTEQLGDPLIEELVITHFMWN